MAEDYYKILGVERSSSPEEISKAYRKLARKHHPDLNPDDKGAKKKFQEIQKAYDVLNEPEKRSMYDQFGANFEQMRGGGPFPGGGQQVDLGDIFGRGGAAFGGMDLNDVFAQFAGGGGGTRRGRRGGSSPVGQNVAAEITILFQTAVTGGETSISLDRGNGQPETIQVKIPAGLEDGKKIRLRGQGQPAPGGTAGDLLLTVHVSTHPHFRRVNQNLELRLPVSLNEAIQGAKVDVPTPGGIVSLKLPAMCSSGQRLRIKGQGVRTADQGAGDLFVEILIKLPSNLDDATKASIQAFESKSPSTPRHGLAW